jgi:peptidoglycan hydrolase-like protein with peptidoglycan-binding domain
VPNSLHRRAAASILLLAGATLAQTAVAGPASAATPTCTKTVTYQNAWVPAASNGSVTCLMSRGANSDAVRQLQDSLNDCYAARFESEDRALWPLVQDGDFGGNTEKALKRVQTFVRISSDGKYGPQTRANMLHTTPLFADPCKYVT